MYYGDFLWTLTITNFLLYIVIGLDQINNQIITKKKEVPYESKQFLHMYTYYNYGKQFWLYIKE